MQYVTTDEFLAAPLGSNIKDVDPGSLAECCLQAEETVNAYCGGDRDAFSFSYQRHRRERHRWRGDSFTFAVFHGPIRTIADMRLITGTYTGRLRSFRVQCYPWVSGVTGNDVQVGTWDPRTPSQVANDLNWDYTSPTGAPPDPDDLPTVFGDISINRATDSGQATNLLLATGAVPLVLFQDPWIEVTYTSGYDDGSVQADGYTRSYPSWLKRATILVIADAMGEVINRKRGMSGLLELKVGESTYRRPIVRPRIDVAINPTAKQILDRHQQMWAA